jgi:hypothetical protein
VITSNVSVALESRDGCDALKRLSDETELDYSGQPIESLV